MPIWWHIEINIRFWARNRSLLKNRFDEDSRLKQQKIPLGPHVLPDYQRRLCTCNTIGTDRRPRRSEQCAVEAMICWTVTTQYVCRWCGCLTDRQTSFLPLPQVLSDDDIKVFSIICNQSISCSCPTYSPFVRSSVLMVTSKSGSFTSSASLAQLHPSIQWTGRCWFRLTGLSGIGADDGRDFCCAPSAVYTVCMRGRTGGGRLG